MRNPVGQLNNHMNGTLVTYNYNLTTVKFDPCEQQWTQETLPLLSINDSVPIERRIPSHLQCLYAHNKFAKVISHNPFHCPFIGQ